MSAIAFIESNTSGTGEKFIESARDLGYEVLFLTAHPKKYKFIEKKLIYPTIVNTNDPDAIYQVLKNVPDLRGVLSTSESYIEIASLIAENFSLPHASSFAIKKCRNKFELNAVISSLGLAAINSIVINDMSKAIDTLDAFQYPVVVKPNVGTGSIGVKLCTTKEEVANHVSAMQNNSDTFRPMLVQKYVGGEEFSAEIIADNGSYNCLGITKKYLGKPPFFVEKGHDFPAKIDESLQDKVVSELKSVLQEIGIKFGPVHIEFKLYNNQIYIIEINPRLAGGMIPILIEKAYGIPLISNLIKMYVGQKVEFLPIKKLNAKIAFFLPEEVGLLEKIENPKKTKRKISNQIDIAFYKTEGDQIELKGDFSDRIGHVIYVCDSFNECERAINTALKAIKWTINPKHRSNDPRLSYARDRLRSPLDNRISRILTWNFFDEKINLRLLSKINAAHVLMLQDVNVISKNHAVSLLKTIYEIEQCNFDEVLAITRPENGYYLAYERILEEHLHPSIAGIIHTGRSRNDINTTVQRIKTRIIYKKLYHVLWVLRSTILQVASKSENIAMPIYSQYQPAMPGTYAYYLLAVERGLAAMQVRLKQCVEAMNMPTLGSASGGGTSFAINSAITAELLGFNKVKVKNALHIVASRDQELDLLFCAAHIGVILSRVAHDFQIWSTAEFNFIDIPDALCGISSAMPQKKNPYLLEKIKGKSASISGVLMSALAVMQKTPYANSLEVGTEALRDYITGLEEIIRSIQMLSLVIESSVPIEKNMLKSNQTGLTVAMCLSEEIVRNSDSVNFRETHQLVGKTISNALDLNQDPLDNILKLSANVSDDPREWHHCLEYGGGPGLALNKNLLSEAVAQLNEDGAFIRMCVNYWNKADEILVDRVDKMIS